MGSANAADDFARISSVPALFANQEAGIIPRLAGSREAGGGFAVAGVAWLKW